MTLTAYTRYDKNKVSSINKMLICLEITIPCVNEAMNIAYATLSDPGLNTSNSLYLEDVGETLPCNTAFKFSDSDIVYQLIQDSIEIPNKTIIHFTPFLQESYSTGTTITFEESSTFKVYVVKDNEDLVWQSRIWYAADFELDEIMETSKGEVPRLDLRISNTNRVVELYFQQYDFFLKTHGYQPIIVHIYVVNSGNTTNGVLNPEYEIDFIFELKQPKTNDKVATFTLGATNPYTHRFPMVRILKNQGKVRTFKDWECRSTATHVSCDRSLTDCIERGNEERYCGYPGIGNASIKI